MMVMPTKRHNVTKKVVPPTSGKTLEKLDALDERLLAMLTKNARESATALGVRLGLSRPAVHARIKRLEAQGTIQGYTIVAQTRPNTLIRAHVLVAVEPKLHDKTIDNIRLMRAVERVYTVSGEYDLIVELAALTTQALDDVLTRIGMVPGVKRTQSSVILSTRVDRELRN